LSVPRNIEYIDTLWRENLKLGTLNLVANKATTTIYMAARKGMQ